jgi:hypothetical protein
VLRGWCGALRTRGLDWQSCSSDFVVVPVTLIISCGAGAGVACCDANAFLSHCRTMDSPWPRLEICKASESLTNPCRWVGFTRANAKATWDTLGKGLVQNHAAMHQSRTR